MIRAETALSRFPLHRIAKKVKPINIELKNQLSAIYWSVSHNTKYGQPGPLAYKIDTLLVNRRIEQAGKPTPKIIRLGTLAAISQELGTASHNWDAIKLALSQNATATITAKLSYRAHDKTEKWLEAIFNRYNIIFTGERLPDGTASDAVYIVLSDIYQEILNTAVFRPLDYEYMKSLPPAAQRFYEIASYQIYAAVHHHNPRARLVYSEYCQLSTATRYFDFDHVKKQMYKVLRPHIQSGYLGKVEYEHITNEQGEADWLMFLTPGHNASREYDAFTGGASAQRTQRTQRTQRPRKPGPRSREETPDSGTPSLPATLPVLPTAEESRVAHKSAGRDEPIQNEPSEGDGSTRELITLLVAADLNRSDAERFAREQPEVCRRQLAYLPFVREFKSSRGAYLRRAIEGDFGAPAAYTRQQAQQQARQQAEETATQRRGQEEAGTKQHQARQSHQDRFSEAYKQYLRERVREASETQPEAAKAFVDQEVAQRSTYTSGPLAGRPLTEKALQVFDQEASRLERARLFWCKQGVEVLSFWEWDEALNPEPARV